jgi:hypothetical protein
MRAMKIAYLLLAIQLMCLPLRGQIPSVRKVELSAYSLSSSTLISIDTIRIHYSAPYKAKIKHPYQFISRLNILLSKKDTIPVSNFKLNYVRFLFKVYYKNGKNKSIYLAQGSSLLIDNKLYVLDRALKDLIREFLPDKDILLPIAKSSKK